MDVMEKKMETMELSFAEFLYNIEIWEWFWICEQKIFQ